MKKSICMIGHRGYSAKHLQNTAEAFIGAAKNKSGGVETDVRITADGVFVLSHNATAVFNDGTELEVAVSTYEELSKKPLKNETCSEVSYICTFQRYLEICREYNMICFIEFKGVFPEEKINEALELADEVYDLSKCILQSFNFDNLIKAHERFPKLEIMLTWGSDRGPYDRCFEYGFSIDSSYWSATPKLIKDFHSRGLKVGLWTANSFWALAKCRLLKPDYIESDKYGG